MQPLLTTIRFTEADQRIIDEIRQATGLQSRAEVLRLGLRQLRGVLVADDGTLQRQSRTARRSHG